MAVIAFKGRVIGAPELKFSQAGKAYLRFRTVENSRRQIDGEWKDVGAAWRDVTVFGRDAETLFETLKEKDVVTVSGRLDCRDWEKDGRKGTSYEVVADFVGIIPVMQAGGGAQTFTPNQASSGFVQAPGQPAQSTGWVNHATGQPQDPWQTTPTEPPF